MKKILLLSHIPTRDDIVDNLIVEALLQVNTVWKTSILGYIRGIILFLKPDIVIMPEIRIESTWDMAEHLHNWGVQVVQRRCEMGVTEETETDKELETAIFGRKPIHEFIDLDLVWGPKFARMVAEHGTPKKKIKVIGGIGFDSYFLPSPPIERRKKKVVLFATGFGYAERNAIYAIPEAAPGDAIHHKLVVKDRADRENFVRLMEKFMQLTDWECWLRQHPGEKATFYKERFGDKINVAPNEPPLASLVRADVVVHTGSTMAYEAHLLNKPAINFRNSSLDTLVGGISPLYSQPDRVLAAVLTTDLTKSNADLKVIAKLNKDYYGKVDGKAHERAAKEINKLPETKTNYPKEWPKDEPKYLTPGVLLNVETWHCGACGHQYNALPGRETLKCPYCGIANIKIAGFCQVCGRPFDEGK